MSNGEVLVALLGAGREQLPALRSARSLGLKVVALDGQATAPGLKEADQSFVLDLSDEAEVIELLAKSGISAVIPAPIGRMLTTVGAVNDALGLRGTSAEAARACVDTLRSGRSRSWAPSAASEGSSEPRRASGSGAETPTVHSETLAWFRK